MFPDEGILTAAQLAFIIYKKLDKKGPCTYFKNVFVIPFKKEISERDYDFFMKGTLTFPYFEKASDRIRLLWESVGDADREAVWDHLNVLIMLSENAVTA